MPKRIRTIESLESDLEDWQSDGKFDSAQRDEWQEQAEADQLMKYKESQRYKDAILLRVWKLAKKHSHIRKPREIPGCKYPNCQNVGILRFGLFCADHANSAQAKKERLTRAKEKLKAAQEQLKLLEREAKT